MKQSMLKSPALLVIDMQKYFIDSKGDAYLGQKPMLVKNILKLAGAFERAHYPIFLTRHAHNRTSPGHSMNTWWEGDLLYEDDPQVEIIPELLPLVKNSPIRKDRYSAFEGTSLEKILRSQSVIELVLCGVMTHICVETTARHAFLKDFLPIIAHDACAASSDEHHRASLLNLSHGFASIVSTPSLIKLL